jgi:hypothetical protein
MKVYLISSEINNYVLYKIGITKREVSQRLKELKTGNAAELNVVSIFESKWATKIEANLHKRYKHINGEWFFLNEEEVKNFDSICKMVHDNFELIYTKNSFYIDKNK